MAAPTSGRGCGGAEADGTCVCVGGGGKVTKGGADPAHNTTECLKSSEELAEEKAV